MFRNASLSGFTTDLRDAFVYPFETWRGTAGFVFVSFLTYLVLIMSTMPEFSFQMLSNGVGWLGYVVVNLTETTYHTSGVTSVGTLVLYAVLTGIAVVNVGGQIRVVGPSSLKDLTGVVPALVASGCASCGAGLLGLLGFTGALAAMPYDGMLVRVGGLALLLFFLGRAGHPKRCGLDGGTDA